MSSIGHYKSLARRGSILGVGVAVLLALIILIRVFSMPVINDSNQSADTPEWLTPISLDSTDWSIIAPSSIGQVSQSKGPISSMFRLAGTFIAYGGSDDRRRAILDDLIAHRQKIVSENDQLGDLLVLRIFTDHIVIRGPQGEEQLWLSFSNPREKKVEAAPAKKNGFKEKKNKYGTQVGKRSYIIDREALLDYYNELMDEPERLVKVFDSLKPIWTADRKIDGYHLDIEGEKEFFKEIGWKQGDVVRAVNSMEMSNRRRAEYFIKEFVADRANAFLIDMERDDKPMKMVYRVR